MPYNLRSRSIDTVFDTINQQDNSTKYDNLINQQDNFTKYDNLTRSDLFQKINQYINLHEQCAHYSIERSNNFINALDATIKYIEKHIFYQHILLNPLCDSNVQTFIKNQLYYTDNISKSLDNLNKIQNSPRVPII